MNNEQKKWADELKEKEKTKGLVFKVRMAEGRANKFIEKEIEPKATQPKDEMGVQGIWTDWLVNAVKEKALDFIISVARSLAVKALPWAIDGANAIINGLEDKIIELYQKANEEEQKAFREKIIETWPESSLARRLKSHYGNGN